MGKTSESGSHKPISTARARTSIPSVSSHHDFCPPAPQPQPQPQAQPHLQPFDSIARENSRAVSTTIKNTTENLAVIRSNRSLHTWPQGPSELANTLAIRRARHPVSTPTPQKASPNARMTPGANPTSCHTDRGSRRVFVDAVDH